MKSTANIPKSSSHLRATSKVHDVLFVLFKQKWKILFLSLMGFGAAGALLYKAMLSPSYETQAKLLVRYVLERSTVDPYESKVDAAGVRGMSVMDAEIEIIRSTDLLLEVVRKIGPEKILPESNPAPNEADAVLQFMLNLEVTAARGSNVIHISYRSQDPTVAIDVLNQLIDCYFAKHLEIHRSTGAFENVARQAEQARSRLSQTEAELSKLNLKSGVMSLADSKAALEARRSSVRTSLLAAQVEYAEQLVKVSSIESAIGVLPEANATPEASGSQPVRSSPEQLETVRIQQEFRDLAEQLSLFKQRRNELLMTRKPGDRRIVALDEQIAAIQKRSLDLVEHHPNLASQAKAPGKGTPQNPTIDLNAERACLAALDAKVKALAIQAEHIDSEVDELSTIGLELTNLERRRQIEEEKYRYFETSLEKARVDEALDPASMPNIGVVQRPSAPVKSITGSTKRLVGGIAAAGVMSGLMLAFLVECVIDRRVSRPIEIPVRLQLPLMLSIPRIRSNDEVSKLIRTMPDHLATDAPDIGAVSVVEAEHFIIPFASAIRDRIMFSFEVNNITHKPKLVAVTSLSKGAGTSTIAAGIARAFAENNNQKVLLVDLNPAKRTAGPQEHDTVSLWSALETSKTRDFRRSPRNLYLASAPTRRCGKNSTRLASTAVHELMPQLEASEFDYIVFDLPPVGPTSPTIAMAGFMDKVLLVLDAENTNRESLSWSFSELEKGCADVSCIFNKAKSHAPRWVTGEA
jgi:uncharacterized protein involved in exopolysaccharide biosynthesis